MPRALSTPEIQQILAEKAAARGGDTLTVLELQQVLTAGQFTGVLVLHYQGGKANKVELGRPTLLNLVGGS